VREYNLTDVESKIEEKNSIPSRIRELHDQKRDLPARTKKLRKLMSNCDEEIEYLRGLLQDMSDRKRNEDCKGNDRMGNDGRKRKLDATLDRSPKKRLVSENDSNAVETMAITRTANEPTIARSNVAKPRLAENEPNAQCFGQAREEETPPPAFSKQELKENIALLRKKKQEYSDERDKILEMIEDIDEELGGMDAKRRELKASIALACIKARNDSSKTEIREQFADGIRDIDQEIAMERRDLSLESSECVRDYSAIAAGLPMFCVCSTAYQKLCGRLRADSTNVVGFKDVDDTEIPQLRKHCYGIAEMKGVTSSQHYLTQYSSLVTSLTVWAINQDGGRDQGVTNADLLQRGIMTLQKV
jgi:hypothetical protein